MRVISIADTPFWDIPYQTAGPGGVPQIMSLPLVHGTVDMLPSGVAALLACSDLQGRELRRDDGHVPRLLGEVLAHDLAFLLEMGELPDLRHVGVLLLGDLYAAPEVGRGQHGDVQCVWRAFAQQCRWVVGVAGNHDDIDASSVGDAGVVHLLDGGVIEVGGLRIGGVSGIIGDARKGRAWRRSEADFTRMMRAVLYSHPNILLLHQGPEVSEMKLIGSPIIRTVLTTEPDVLTVCGHVHWTVPLATLPSGGQVLNVDARAVLLTVAR